MFGDGYLLPPISLLLSNEEFVKASIDRARDFFNKESGNNEAKKKNLSENLFTKVETPLILRQSLLKQGLTDEQKEKVQISGNVKVLLPLSRELLLPEPLPDNA